MTAALPPGDRRKLVGVLGMLGSDAVGERAAAVLLATRMVKAHGLVWDDLIGPAPAQQHQQQAAPRPRADDGGDLALCIRHLGVVNAWEAGFVRSVQRSRKRSARQLEILAGIAGGLRARGFV